VSVRDYYASEWLSDLIKCRPKVARVRKKKRRVDRNDFLRGFDQVRIDCILFSCVLMNYDIV
jgi:hypothetical protein